MEPERWRGNIYVEAPMGDEYEWVKEKATLVINGVRFQVVKPLGRCAMITGNPKTGERDHPQLLAIYVNLKATGCSLIEKMHL